MDRERTDPPPVASAVLAGGAASRMGGNKAGAILAGRSLISFPVTALKEAGLEPFIVTKADRPVGGLPELEDLPVVVEPDRPRHPLLGVLAAMERAGDSDLIVLACDLPLVPPPFLRWLAGEVTGTVVPLAGGRLQPLAARYGYEAIEAVRCAVAKERPVTGLIRELDPVIVGEERLREFGDPTRMFENVNSHDDLIRVGRHLSG
ncbi:MAG: molybdenum cofactor guanylyltransferase [Solirubrobacterales bacterium]|nr:molybdenum cofactor guanylyltransferase [Solirubrobacterales bacterium]